eukprot:m.11586 g.11586  ORF g.11586 m.11586 type:complete len:414 (-) comp7758_c0_seq2:46-1287(-)
MARCLIALFALFVTVQAVDNGLGLLPRLGWNTWCTLGKCGRDYCDEKEIREMADAMTESGLQALGFDYLELDDCWASHRDNKTGEITADPDRFPSGMKNLTDYLHARGFSFGLYTDAGVYTCSSGERPYKIPGSYGHYEQDANTYASWGVDGVKMDWCNTNINGSELHPETQYAQMSKALNATGRPFYFTSCEWGVDNPWFWMRKYANAWRATGDHHDDWGNTAGIIEQVSGIGAYSGPGGWNYMDFLMTGGQGCDSKIPGQRCPGMTDLEYITEFSIFVIAASPIIVATELRNMTAIQKQVLFNTEMLDVHQDKLARAGQRVGFWNCTGKQDVCQLWARPLFNGDQAIALYNSDERTHSITFPFSVIGWINTKVAVRDLWAHKDLGVFETSVTADDIPPHGVAVYRISLANA